MSKQVNYQQLSTELDAVLTELQSEDIDIDKALELYKRGEVIVKELETYLKTSENKIKKLTVNELSGK